MSRDKQRRGELAPISALLPGIVGEIQVAPELTQAKALPRRASITTAHQIAELLAVRAMKAPDMGFMTRLLTLCSLPRTDPGNRLQYKRENGPNKLIMIAGGDTTNSLMARRRVSCWHGPALRP